MTLTLKRGILPLTLLATVLLAGCGVSQSQYDALQAQNQQLQQQVAADQQHISRLQSAIKYTVNSDLLFPSGSWQISADGKSIMTKMASQLAAYQQDKLVVNGYTDNAPIGPALAREGVTSNEVLSQKRADSVMQFLISQGVKSNLISAKGWGEANPIASNSTPKGRAQNRRVEITLAGSAS
jgi:chemotaxis protein MotB